MVTVDITLSLDGSASEEMAVADGTARMKPIQGPEKRKKPSAMRAATKGEGIQNVRCESVIISPG